MTLDFFKICLTMGSECNLNMIDLKKHDISCPSEFMVINLKPCNSDWDLNARSFS